MMFNNRRQTKDRMVIQKIKKKKKNNFLHLSEYSKPLFQGEDNLIEFGTRWRNEVIIKGEESDYFFIEDSRPKDYECIIHRIILFCWNKTYPADSFFDIDLNNYEQKEEIEFEGYSHEKISMKIYDRRRDYE